MALVNDQYTGTVRAGVYQPWLDGVRQAILGGLVNDIHGFGYAAALRQRFSFCQRGDDREDERGLAITGITLHHSQLADRYVRVPQPLHRFDGNVTHVDQV